MKKTLLICALAALALACQGDAVRRDQQKYQTVQEGSTAGVTSTINAPGIVSPPMTATNADTTSNLSLPLATTGTAFGQAGSLAGTMTTTQSGSMSVPYPADVQGYPVAGSTPRAPRSRPAARPSPEAPAPPMTSAAPEQPHRPVEPQPEPAPEPVPTETSTPPAPPAPSTDTTTTTQGTPARPKPQPPPPPPPPPPSTDTSTTTSPPPPTQT